MTRPPLFGACRLSRALAVVLAVTALLVGAATAAQAHNILVGTSPTAGSTAPVVPTHVTLTFNEPALAIGTEIIVTGPAGQEQTGLAVLVNNTVTEHLQPGAPAGPYTVIWRATSADGHPVSGTFAFTAATASPGQRSASPTPTSSPTFVPGTSSGQSPAVWWVVAGGVVVLMLLALFVRARRPRHTP